MSDDLEALLPRKLKAEGVMDDLVRHVKGTWDGTSIFRFLEFMNLHGYRLQKRNGVSADLVKTLRHQQRLRESVKSKRLDVDGVSKRS